MIQNEEASVELNYLVFSPEARHLLAKNDVSLASILARSNLSPNEAREVPNPARPPEGAREPVTIILASAAAIATLTPLITRVLHAYTQRPVVVEDSELVALLDGDGKAVRRADGEPVLVWRSKKRLLEPRNQPTRQEVTVKALGFEISIKQS